MSARRMNILVYAGHGSTVDSVRHCLYTLRRFLAPNYAVIPITGDMIIKEPWTATCAAIVFPGGADLGYARTLNGAGNRRIRQYVEQGGRYIGFCAGGYYGGSRCEFEVGNTTLEVVGDRELAFYPGTVRGCAFAGFVYNSEKGARAAELHTNNSALSQGKVPTMFRSYYNGGGVFVDAVNYKDKGVEVLADYVEDLSCDAGHGKAAVVYCSIGTGAALLTGPHPEFVYFHNPTDNWALTKPRFAAANLDAKPDVPGFDDVKKLLAADEHHRMDFLKACLTKLGLIVSDEQNVPSLSRLHLSALHPHDAEALMTKLAALVVLDSAGNELLKDANDVFHIVKRSTWSMADMASALPTECLDTRGQQNNADESDRSSTDVLDYNAVIKQLLFHDVDYPNVKTTPYFNHSAFYTNLSHYQKKQKTDAATFGTHLMYGEVVTSTNSLLEKNVHLLRELPHGFTATATIQVAGRGRGSNVWISPAGNLMFSTVIRHPMSMLQSAPVTFIQYLAAMAIVEGIKNYGGGTQYKNMPIKLKWPNDIYALDPDSIAENGNVHGKYTKIGGVLVNSHYNSTDFIAVCGIGLNVANRAPTTSLNQLIPLLPSLSPHHKARTQPPPPPPPPPPPFALEPLLASVLVSLESLYTRFLRTGFDEYLEQLYYRDWLHMDQIVTLETHHGARAIVRGITREHGLLVADELGSDERPTGQRWELMSDSNSFDFFKGLVRTKQS